LFSSGSFLLSRLWIGLGTDFPLLYSIHLTGARLIFLSDLVMISDGFLSSLHSDWQLSNPAKSLTLPGFSFFSPYGFPSSVFHRFLFPHKISSFTCTPFRIQTETFPPAQSPRVGGFFRPGLSKTFFSLLELNQSSSVTQCTFFSLLFFFLSPLPPSSLSFVSPPLLHQPSLFRSSPFSFRSHVSSGLFLKNRRSLGTRAGLSF